MRRASFHIVLVYDTFGDGSRSIGPFYRTKGREDIRAASVARLLVGDGFIEVQDQARQRGVGRQFDGVELRVAR